MNFIETLKSVGGFKPCRFCGGTGKTDEDDGKGPLPCECVEEFDLAPLLARPDHVATVSGLLTVDLFKQIELNKLVGEEVVPEIPFFTNLHVVGPQRASNLVYEVARQLGGTAVNIGWQRQVYENPALGESINFVQVLSTPVPESATVLFVTDAFHNDMTEFDNILKLVSKSKKLPYILCLVNFSGADGITDAKIGRADIISLHKENS